MKNQKIITELFGNDSEFVQDYIGSNKEKQICKNNHEIYETKFGNVVVKNFLKETTFNREKQAYNFFLENKLISVPRLYYAENSTIITDLVHSNKRYNLETVIDDWAKIHSLTLNNKGDFEIYDSRNVHVPDQIRPKLNLISLTHGDLYSNNVLNFNGEHYYIDFETFGLGHPARDLSLLLFNEPNSKEQIIEQYRKKIDFDYPELVEDINLLYKIKLRVIIETLKKDTNIPLKFREKFIQKAENQLKEENHS
jgi:thiamine kinase-like enzyme|tara:strand:+ start:2308 stop:3066 length:759 start_codon:yes stop_codon:yes gene_type:complete